jgi:hypothetical protein
MEIRELPPVVEPDYWNVVFHPSDGVLPRLCFGRFQHVSAFTYIPGFSGWILYDVQWAGVRIAMLSKVAHLVAYARGCTVVKFTRRYDHMPLYTRLGFYCVPAIKHLIGLSCVAVSPDGLYRAIIANGGIILNESKCAPAAAAGSDAPAGAGAGAG